MDLERVDRVVGRLENKLAAAWRGVVRALQDANDLAGLEARIAAGMYDELLVGMNAAAVTLTADVAAGYVHAAQQQARALDAEIEGTFRFDLAEPEVTLWIQRMTRDTAAGFAAEQQAAARRVVERGIAVGRTPRQIAEEVRASIGLAPAQVDRIERYRRLLETGDYHAAMRYQLADGRYDAMLGRAAGRETVIGAAKIDAMVARYRGAWVAQRGAGIAEREAQAAVAAGQEAAARQFAQAGPAELTAEHAIVWTWWSRQDPRTRASHRPMHGQERVLGRPFLSGAGIALRYPGDEEAPAEETAGCRCRRTLRIALRDSVVAAGA